MSNNTIILRGQREVIRKEAIAGGAITPGYLLERTSTGTVQAHSTAAHSAQLLFAVENEVVGNGITDAYAANDTVLMAACQSGVEIYALVPASAAAIVIGDFLESAGDGTLRKVATDTATDEGERNSVVAVALEAVDNSGGGSAARIKVELV